MNATKHGHHSFMFSIQIPTCYQSLSPPTTRKQQQQQETTNKQNYKQLLQVFDHMLTHALTVIPCIARSNLIS